MPRSETKERSVLIVDDSLLILDRLTDMLSENELMQTLFTAENFDEAVEVIGENEPDIVLLDIQLPGDKNGIDLLKLIVKKYPDIKVLMISNQASEHYQRLCRQEGAVGFVDKSKDFDLIPQLIREL